MPEGRLFVCATPIGNLGDISDRLRDVLTGVDVVYAEDTRRTGKLLNHVGAHPRTVSLFTGNERERTDQLLNDLAEGASVALVSDAGMPTVSDPGARAIGEARERGFEVTVIPGPSAVTTALAVTGFGADRFTFEGFLPRKGGDRSARLREIAADVRTVVLFSSPNRVGKDLEDLRVVAGADRQVVVTRELTKLHEEVWSGTLAEAADRWNGDQKGEFTLVMEPGQASEPSVEDAIEIARALVEDGTATSEAARTAARETGVSRRAIYQALLGQETI